MSRESCPRVPARLACRSIAPILATALLLLTFLPHPAGACNGSGLPAVPCARSVVLVKAMPFTVAIPAGATVVPVPVFLITTCVGNCPMPQVLAASITVTIGAPPVGTGTISTAMGTLPLPACAPGGSLLTAIVPVPVPAGTAGILPVAGVATVFFNGGATFTATGDTFVSFVEEAAGQPGVPRLAVELVSPAPGNPFLRAAGGSQVEAVYRVTNNDPSENVSVTLTARSRQNARMPGGNTQGTAFSISAPTTGDDFPHAFDAPSCSISLPANPAAFVAPDITKPLTLAPGESELVTVDIRSYAKCATGSCTENSLLAQGTFAGGDLAEACAATAYVVDNSQPSNCCNPREVVMPLCDLRFLAEGVDATVQDTGSGIAEILPLELKNATLSIPPFTPGTQQPLVVQARKVNPNLSARVLLKLQDRCGNTLPCDPVLTLAVREAGKPAVEILGDMPQEDDTVTVMNGTPGLRHLDVVVNGVRFKVQGLADGEERDLDISSALLPGSHNSVALSGRGKPGGQATIAIWDGGP